jgi:hypothetical protein
MAARFCLAAFLVVAALAVAAAHPADGKPSRAPGKGCAWEKMSDAAIGLDAWVQRCDFGFRKIDFVFAGNALAQRYDAGQPDPLVEVLDLHVDESEQAGLTRLFGEHTDKTIAAKCVLKPYKYYKASPRGIKRYTFVPNPQYQKQVDAEQDPNEVGDPACGDWGDAPDGIQYFEVQPVSKPARRVLFVRIGQDEPLFDEQTLKILPAPERPAHPDVPVPRAVASGILPTATRVHSYTSHAMQERPTQ